MVKKYLIYWKNISNVKLDQLFFLIIGTDIILIIIHCLILLGLSTQYYRILSLTTDQSIPETYQYIKELWIFLILGFSFFTKKDFIYLFWSLLFLFFLLDDFIGIHETIGKVLVQKLELMPKFYLRSQDFGEILVVLIVGFVFALMLLLAFIKSKNEGKRTSKILFLLVLLLVFFGVGIDMLHSASDHLSRYLYKILALIEDGGEMIVMSLILWYTLNRETLNEKLYK